ncbi:hypothetical protein WAI453_010945 [Rhynchosporium graminicola]|uniref:Uncharacterized protein n=1 Tax=Rhynchosporium graminicola TaxID=2792576 RepID=A0A1E1LL94_9HELO|nr:uncharacterized protein RCO7_09942 [Rhynchosporium commune]
MLYRWPFECEIQDANESSPKMMFQIYSFPDKDFLNTFVLDFLAIAFDDRCAIRDLSKKYPETPPRFETVKKARLRLYVIVRRVQQLYASISITKFFPTFQLWIPTPTKTPKLGMDD